MTTLHCAKCGNSLTPEQSGYPCPNCGNLDRNNAVADQALAADKAEAAKELAKKHYEIETGLTQIFRVTGKAEVEVVRAEPIKLLEVNENTAPSGVMPLHFGPAPASGIFYPSIIVEVTPAEFKKIQSHELPLPTGWEHWEELPKPSDGTEAA
jgi:uncharacterized Zn finger protein (UPF0148 family)